MNAPKNKASPDSGLSVIYGTHLTALKRFISSIVSNRHDIDDVAQEAFLRTYQAGQGKVIEQPKYYLFQVARNVALNKIKQKMRQPTDFIEDYQPSLLQADDSLEEEMMAQQKLEILCAAIATLPVKCRKVYLMRKVYGMSYKEIAEAMEITVSTVEAHIEKGYSRCDAYVAERLGESLRVKRNVAQQGRK